jgi:protein-tyrosine kinase
MKLIERAAKRLEELRLAGVQVDDAVPSASDSARASYSSTKEVRGDSLSKEGSLSCSSSDEGRVVARSRSVDLNLEAMSSSGFISPKVARARISDEFRMIKRPLIANAVGKSAAPIEFGNLIMVTSAMPGEGKTFTAINLAMSIAMELDHTVMLVDADVARPSVLNVLGLPPAPGFIDVLIDKSIDLSSVLLKTNVDGLTLLPSGMQHDSATELLASDAMTALLAEMSNRYRDRIIIFDSPPLLLTTESPVLAKHMGQVVVVVHAEKTLRGDLQQALASIESCPVKMMLLNQARTAFRPAYGAYGYGE